MDQLGPSKDAVWAYQSSSNRGATLGQNGWNYYSDAENNVIEQAYLNKEPTVHLDSFNIDFKKHLQISRRNPHDQRQVKRVIRKSPSEERRKRDVMDLPVTFQHTFSGEYGWISVFIMETKKYLGLKEDEIPSKKPGLIPRLVEKAAEGITEEGVQYGKENEAKYIARLLMEAKNATMQVVWERCAHLYSLESFLYKSLNTSMRLIGDKENEKIWKSKISTLGPFSLLFWDDPFDRGLCLDRTLYRGATLTSEQISIYDNASKNANGYGSFQAFTSCTRNRAKAEEFGNCLFIMHIEFAFVTDISSLSAYPGEEEEIITPGVCLDVRGVEFDVNRSKHIIYLLLKQRFSGRHKKELSARGRSSQQQKQPSRLAAGLAKLKRNDLSDKTLSGILGDISLHDLDDDDAVLLDDLLGFQNQAIRHSHVDPNREVRMVLLGGTGNGKSSFGNTIIGNKIFKAQRSDTSITKKCHVENCEYQGKQLVVVDTPGFFDTELPREVIEDEIAKSYQILAPGPHAFLIVHNVVHRFTEEQRAAAKRVKAVFGEDAANFCIVVFTGIDTIEDEFPTIEDYLNSLKSDSALKKVLSDFGGRYIAVNNKGSDSHQRNVRDKLLAMIQTNVSRTADGYYTTSQFQEVADAVVKSKTLGHDMVNSDGSIILMPEVKEIVGTYLLRNLGRNSIKKN